MSEPLPRPGRLRFFLAARRIPRRLSAADRMRNCAIVLGGRVIAGMQWRSAGLDFGGGS